MNTEFQITDLALKSSFTIALIQFVILNIVAAIRVRVLIKTRIGGVENIRVLSWPRVVLGFTACNGAYIGAHHLFIHFGPSVLESSNFAFIGLHFLMVTVLSLAVITPLGLVFDCGKAIRVLSERYKPDHSPMLIDMTKDHGSSAQLIPRGAIFAYMYFMFFTWIARGWLLSKGG